MIEIIPPSPDELTPITLKANISGCVKSTQLVNNDPIFTAEITFQAGCFSTPPQGDYLFPLGKLPSGNYTAQVKYIDSNGTSSIDTSKAFTVSAADIPRSIPTLDTSAFMFLSLTLFLVATAFGRKHAVHR